MTPELLRQVGEALYGPEWRMALARDLGVNYHTMRRWHGGTAPIPAGVQSDLRQMLSDQVAELSRVLAALGEAEEPFPVGRRVEAGMGTDYDAGTIIEAHGIDLAHPMAGRGDTRFVAWDSGVRTWTPVSELR